MYQSILVGPNDEVVKLYYLTSLSESASSVLSTLVPSREQPVANARVAPPPPKQQPQPGGDIELDKEMGEPHAPPNSASPFTLPVAMLLFRVARALFKHSGARSARTVRRLVNGALALIDPQLNSEVLPH